MTIAEPLPSVLRVNPDPAELVGTWTVAQCLTNHESRIAAFLDELGIPCFHPVCQRSDLYRKRAREYRRPSPLFPGYVFACCPLPIDAWGLRRHRSVYNLIDVVNQAQLSRELGQIYIAMQHYQVDPYPYAAVGRRVIIRPPHKLQGLEGTVIYRKQTCRVTLSVEILGRAGVSLEIEDPDLLEPVDG